MPTITIDGWTVIGSVFGVLGVILTVWFYFRDNRVRLKASIVASERAGEPTIFKPGRRNPTCFRLELHLTLTNPSKNSVFLRSVALRDRSGAGGFIFVSEKGEIEELKSGSAFEELVNLGMDWNDFDQVEPIATMDLRKAKTVFQNDGYLEVKLADGKTVTFWAKDICKPDFFGWSDKLAKIVEHHKTKYEKRKLVKTGLIRIEYLGVPYNKWIKKTDEGDGVWVRIGYGRGGNGSSDSVLLERAARFIRSNRSPWLNPAQDAWTLDSDKMRSAFPEMTFPDWFQGTVPVTPQLEKEGIRSDTIKDGVRTPGRDTLLRVVMSVTKDTTGSMESAPKP